MVEIVDKDINIFFFIIIVDVGYSEVVFLDRKFKKFYFWRSYYIWIVIVGLYFFYGNCYYIIYWIFFYIYCNMFLYCLII